MSLYQPIIEFRKKLASGRLCLGPAITLSDPAVTEALGNASDFCWIDLEHTPLSLESVQGHLIAARAVSVPALVRVPGLEAWFMKRVLDAGAGGLIVPQVRSAEEVRQAVAACRYKPQGERGYGPRRASDYGRDDSHYFETANRNLFLAVQIETVEALNALEEIVRLPGLDSVVIGPYDLSVSMGLPGQVDHPNLLEAMRRIVKGALEAGLYVGMGGGLDEEYVLRAARMGVQWIQAGSDFAYMTRCAGQLFALVRRRLAGSQE